MSSISDSAKEDVRIGLNMRRLREINQLSAKELAERMETDPPTVTRLEKGRQRFTIGWINRIVKALDEDIATLISEDPAKDSVELLYRTESDTGDELPAGERMRFRIPAAHTASRYAVVLGDRCGIYPKGAYLIFVYADEMDQPFQIGRFYHVRKKQSETVTASLVCELVEDEQKKLWLRPCSNTTDDATPFAWHGKGIKICGELAGVYQDFWGTHGSFDRGG